VDTAVGIFASRSGAQAAKAKLVAAGVPSERIALSARMTADGIAAEAPGESYVNQRRRDSEADVEAARYGDLVRSGACVVSVLVQSDEERSRLEALMQRLGAHAVTQKPR
jgi:hypothetical protein